MQSSGLTTSWRNRITAETYLDELKAVLIYAAEQGYARDGVEKTLETYGSVTIHIEAGDWGIRDNYFTSPDGRRYFGSMVLSQVNAARWYCGYAGEVVSSANPKWVYGFLRQALLSPEPDFPVRGPWHMAQDERKYQFRKATHAADLSLFVAEESINFGSIPVYQGVFHGGIIG